LVIAGAVLLIAGAAILGGYWVYSVLIGHMPILMKISLVAIPGGILLLSLGVLRDKLKKRRRGDIKEEV